MALFGDSKKKAEKLAQAEEYDAAAEMYARLGEYLEAGRIYENLGRLHDALELYRRGGELERVAEVCLRVGAYGESAEAFAALGRPERAGEMYEKAGRLADAAAQFAAAGAHGRAGEIAFLLERFEDAAGHFERAGRYGRAAEAWIEARSLPRALEVADKIDDPLDAERLADRLVERGHVDEAVALLTRDGEIWRRAGDATVADAEAPAPARASVEGAVLTAAGRRVALRLVEDVDEEARGALDESAVARALHVYRHGGERQWVRRSLEEGRVRPEFDARDLVVSPTRDAFVVLGRSPTSYLKETTTALDASGRVLWSHEHDYHDTYRYAFHRAGEEYAVAFGTATGVQDHVEYRDLDGRRLWRRDVPKTVKAVAFATPQSVVATVSASAAAITVVHHDRQGNFISKKSTGALPPWWDAAVEVLRADLGADGERLFLVCRDKTGAAYAMLLNGDLDELWHRAGFTGAMARDGRRIVGYDAGDPERLLCLDGGEALLWSRALEGPVRAIDLSADGRFALVRSEPDALAYVNAEGETIWSARFPGLAAAALAASGRAVAAVTTAKEVRESATHPIERVRVRFEIFEFNLGLLRAAEILAEAGRDEAAAELFERFGFIERSLALYRATGEREKFAILCERHGRLADAAEAWAELGETARAADLLAGAGEFARARALYEQIGAADRVRDMLEAEGSFRSLAQVYEAEGQFAEAASAFERAGDFLHAERMYRRAGDDGRAEEMARRGGSESAELERLKLDVWAVADDIVARLGPDLVDYFLARVLGVLERNLEWADGLADESVANLRASAEGAARTAAAAIVTRLRGHELWLAEAVGDPAGRALPSENAALWAEVAAVGAAIETFLRDHDIPTVDADEEARAGAGLRALLAGVETAAARTPWGALAPVDEGEFGDRDAYGALGLRYWEAVQALHAERDRLRDQALARRRERLHKRWHGGPAA